MNLLDKDYITEKELKEINVCPGKSLLKTWILKNSITEIKKCVENSNTWKQLGENFQKRKKSGWDKKSKEYFIKIINSYVDTDIIYCRNHNEGDERIDPAVVRNGVTWKIPLI